ncbi:NB-ARC domain-containing protein [Dactylosporangium sp. CS-047395]|uniref:NB-ARC domain-containing protein n=1 Tax=Dactylosporangium sp. CS-047395 TaxID=3239936 RepID=UPI003D8EBDF9
MSPRRRPAAWQGAAIASGLAALLNAAVAFNTNLLSALVPQSAVAAHRYWFIASTAVLLLAAAGLAAVAVRPARAETPSRDEAPLVTADGGAVIVRSLQDHGPQFQQLPGSTSDFTGRDGELAALHERLTAGGVAVVALYGMGGVGKSALALAAAHQVKQHFPDGQLFVKLTDGATPVPVEVLLRQVLISLEAPPPPDAGEQAMLALYRSLVTGKRLLIVLDNATDERQVRCLVPTGPVSAMLVTGRRPLDAVEGAHVVPVLPMDDDDGLHLLCRLAPDRTDDASLAALLEPCGGLPLAIRICAGLLRRRPHDAAGVLAQSLKEEQSRLLVAAVGDLEVRASLALSYATLPPDLARLFRRLGCVGSTDFNAEIAAPAAELEAGACEPLLDELVEAQLVMHSPFGFSSYRLHVLVRAFAIDRLDAEEDTATINRALIAYVNGFALAVRRMSMFADATRFNVADDEDEDVRPGTVAGTHVWFRIQMPRVISVTRWMVGYEQFTNAHQVVALAEPYLLTSGDVRGRELFGLGLAAALAAGADAPAARLAVATCEHEIGLADRADWPRIEQLAAQFPGDLPPDLPAETRLRWDVVRAHLALHAGDTDGALRLAAAAEAEAAALELWTIRNSALAFRSRCLLIRGDRGAAELPARQAFADQRQRGDYFGLLRTAELIMLAAHPDPERDEDLQYGHRMFDRLIETPHNVRYYAIWAACLEGSGKWWTALQQYEEVLRIARNRRLLDELPKVTEAIERCRPNAARWETARAHFRETNLRLGEGAITPEFAIGEFRAIGDEMRALHDLDAVATTLVSLGVALMHVGRLDEAWEAQTTALGIATDVDEGFLIAAAKDNCADIATARRDWDLAARLYDEAEAEALRRGLDDLVETVRRDRAAFEQQRAAWQSAN